MDVELNPPSTAPANPAVPTNIRQTERLMLAYWLVATIGGAIFLRDWLGVWNVYDTLRNPSLVFYLIFTFALSQVLYAFVARNDGRPIAPVASAIFAIGNGIAETLAFALVYRLGETLGSWAVGGFAPEFASLAGFGLGVILFVIYGGLIHALFWLRVLPPHLGDEPFSKRVRRFRPVAEIGLVLGWSLCFWLTRDIWLVIFFHILVDVGLMLKVRPPIFGAPAQS